MSRRLAYQNRSSLLVHNGNVYALSIIIAAQFMYLNFHYIIGATLTAIGVASLLTQLVLSTAEERYLESRPERAKLDHLLRAHLYVNNVFILLYAPFLLWAVVLMYEDRVASLVVFPTGAPT
jgi:hypothetical protein